MNKKEKQIDEPYRQQLRENIDILFKLDSNRYPTLNDELRKHKGSFCRRLVQFIEQIEHHPKAPYHDRRGKPWHFVSFQWLAIVYGGSAGTWHSCVVFGAALGLIERRKPYPIPEQICRTAMSRSAAHAKGIGQRAVSWYHIPPYSEELLSKAEAIAQQFKREGISRSMLSTGGLIQAIGKEEANKAIPYSLERSQADIQAEHEIIAHIRQAIKATGYTTKDATLCAAINTWHTWADAARPPYRLWKATVNRVWQNRNKRILNAVYAIYSRPTKDEKEQWHLMDNCWIIRSPP